MKITTADYQYPNDKIFYAYPRLLELDRTLLNLFLLLKFDGKRPVARRKREEVTVKSIVKTSVETHAVRLINFDQYQDVVEDWIYSDLVDMVFRGNPDKEKVTAPVPLHLNAYKLRNTKQVSDYRSAEHLYSMIYHADRGLISDLAEFLGRGADSKDGYDGRTPLDMYTLMIVHMTNVPGLDEKASSERGVIEPPLCIGQARLMCDDLRRLLAYKNLLPRRVLIDYLKIAFGLHLGLYMLRLFHQVSSWVEAKSAHSACLNCPVSPQSATPLAECPFACQSGQDGSIGAQPEILIDLGDDYASHMAKLARDNCALHYGKINSYIRSVFTVNQLFQFAESSKGRRIYRTAPKTVAEVIGILADPPRELEDYYDTRLDNLLPPEELEEERGEVKAIYELRGLSSFEKFIELVSLERVAYYRKYLGQQIDSSLMKNEETCLVVQGKGKRNARRWYMGSRLLEMLAQIALLEPATDGFHSRSLLIEDFIGWLRERYGFVIVPEKANATIQDYGAFNRNLSHLKNRLREIGFYSGLSDAYNTQRLRPRYIVE